MSDAVFNGFSFSARFERWLSEPQHAMRIEMLRVLPPLAILGFMSARVAYADEWLGNAGFRVPNLDAGDDYRQPLFIPGLPTWASWAVALTFVASGLAVAAGFRARKAAVVFACCAAFVALSDRLASFSVSKMAPMVGIVIAMAPVGRFLSLDSWLEKRRRGKKRPKTVPALRVPCGSIRFVQVLLPTIYSASGIAKCRGDWLANSHVLWTHLHDSYQTSVTLFLANTLPPFMWTVFQGVTLAFETGAPLWFSIRKTRPFAMIVGIGMHTMIGLMFGPVRYFAMLMSSLLLVAFLPDRFVELLWSRLRRKKKRPSSSSAEAATSTT